MHPVRRYNSKTALRFTAPLSGSHRPSMLGSSMHCRLRRSFGCSGCDAGDFSISLRYNALSINRECMSKRIAELPGCLCQRGEEEYSTGRKASEEKHMRLINEE